MTETLNPFLATAAGERIAAYAALAGRGPLQRIPAPGGGEAWLITGYAEARAALNDPRLIKAPPPAITERRRERLRNAPGLRSHMLVVDGAEHGRLRRLVLAAFTRRRVEALAPSIQATTDALLDDLTAAAKDGGAVDLVAGFAYPLPMTVICDLLGVPAGLRDDLHDGVQVMARGIGMTDEEFLPRFDNFLETLQELVAAKRRDPQDDLLSALIAVRDGGDALSEDELSSMAFLLVAAGHETTVNLIGNGVHALLTHPDQWELLRDEPTRIPDAVEEFLRWCGPVQVTFPLLAAVPVELAGCAIAPGDIVIPAVFPANRDPAHIADPDVLDVTRGTSTHLAFGHGIHHCLGASMARLEARIAFETLLRRFPGLRLAGSADELMWAPSFLFHGLMHLPVHLN